MRHHWSGGSIVEVNEIISTPATSCVQFNTKLGPTTFFTLCSLPSSTLADSRSDAPKQQQQQQHSFLIQFPLLPQVAAPDLKFAAPSGCKRNRISKSMEEAAVENEMQRLRANQHHLHLSGYYYANLPRKEAVQLLQNTLVFIYSFYLLINYISITQSNQSIPFALSSLGVLHLSFWIRSTSFFFFFLYICIFLSVCFSLDFSFWFKFFALYSNEADRHIRLVVVFVKL